MPFTPFGWVDEPSAELIPSTKKKNNVPVSKGWAAARQEQLNARTSGRQAAPNVDPLVAPIAGQRHGPAYRGGPNDRFSPQGFGVTGLNDVYGVPLPTPGVPRPSQPEVAPRQILPEETTYTNAAGVQQTGRNLGGGGTPINMNRSFNDLLNTVAGGRFASNQLPTTAGSPDTNIGPVADGQEYANNLGRQGTKGVGPVADGQVYGNMLEGGRVKGDQNIGPVANGQEYAESLGKGDIKSGRLADALADTAGINSYMSKFSSGDQERAANRAFLDTEGSMDGLRAKEKVNNVVYAGGQHYVPGESADSPAVKIDRSDARDISNNKAKAEQFKSKKVADTIAATKQEPPTLESAASSQAFKQDKPISATMPGDIGGKTEYYSNNDNVIEPFGGPKGYSSGFKRIDTSMNNPFG